MSQNQKTLELVKDQLKAYLPQYLAAMGVTMSGKLFSCINPDHPDHNPSCGLVPQSQDRVFHCFSCHAVGDIFVAAHFLEGKPLVGHGFVVDNVMYLAHRFGVDVPDLPELTPEEIKEIEAYSAYLHAAMIIRSSELSERVVKGLQERLWPLTQRGESWYPSEALAKLGVGSVKSYEDYINRMTKMYGHKREFLHEMDLDRRAMFSPDNLIFTVRDENGAPVGFACRSLKYADDKKKWEQEKEAIEADLGKGTPEAKEAIDKLWKPSKYVNTKDSCPIYSKKRLLHLFDVARKNAPPLWVFEGYPDGVAAQLGGLTNACDIGATAFTDEHLEMLLGLKVKHLIFVLDADAPGQDAMERIMNMVKSMGNNPGLTVEMLSMPEGTDDPDAYIRSFGDLRRGVQEFRKLRREDMFSWGVRKRIDKGDEPLQVAEETVPLIVNELNNLKRISMTKRLAQATGLPEAFLMKEVQRLVDADLSSVNEEKLALARKMSQELGKNPLGMGVLIETYRQKIEAVEKRKTGYDPANVKSHIEFVFERAEKNDRGIELATRFTLLNKHMGGIPRGQAFISMPGKPNQGKTTFVQNLAWDIVEQNEDAMVFLHSVDDAMSAAIPRILGSRFEVPSDYFRRPAFFRQQVEDFDKIYRQAREWLDDLIEMERLVIADISTLPGTLPAFETWVRTLRNKYPHRWLVAIGDNFHLFDLPGYDPGEGKTRAMSMFIKRLANQYDATMIFTTELPKEALRAGVRPRMARIKGTSGVAYDANANFGIYNDLKDMGDKATICWEGPNEIVYGPNGEECMAPRKMPVLELVIDKSKLSSFDGTIYYRMTPESGRLEECNEIEQSKFHSAAAAYHSNSAGELAGSNAPFKTFT